MHLSPARQPFCNSACSGGGQAVTQGKILAAAEDRSETQRQKLALAERILSECGAEPGRDV